MNARRSVLISAVSFGALSLVVSGCGSSATTVTSPSSLTRCSVSASGGGTLPAGGGTGRISVSAERECSWSAKAEGAWLSIKAGTAGQGDGAVEFSAAPNPDPASRRGAVVLNEQRIEVMQEAAECTIALDGDSAAFPRSGGEGRIDVKASSALCEWQVAADESWIVLRSGAAGKGNGQIAFEVAATSGPPRDGTIRVAGQRFTVSQSDGCTYRVAPLTHSVGSTGGPVSVGVTSPEGCEWRASSGVAWIALNGPASAKGNGTVLFTVAPTAASRSDTVSVAGQPVSISQSASPAPAPPPSPPSACSFSISPEVASVSASGGAGSTRVTTQAQCPWTATSNAPWIQIGSGASGAGPGDVSYSVAPSSGGSRSGTLTIAGRTLTVNQDGGCIYTLSARSADVPAAGGTGSVGVATSGTCAWTATSNAGWLTVTGGAGGTGNGTVTFSAAAQPAGASRTGSLTIAGQTFTVAQSGACTFSISPDSRSVDAQGATLTVTVTAPNSCAWTASSQADWLMVRSSGPESGNGTVEVAVAENRGAARSGTATIAGRTFTVTQTAPACTYSVKPREISLSSDDKLVKVEVRTSRACSWTASSNAPWIRVAWGARGTGDDDVWLYVESNDDKQRQGTVTIAGETVTVTQKKDKD